MKIRIHNLLRIIYIFSTCASLPVAMLYLRKTGSVHLPGLSAFLVVTGGIFWAVFYILFTQRYFSLNISGALLTLAGYFSNYFTAANLGSFDLYCGAYSLVVSSLISQFIFFSTMLIMFMIPQKRKKYFYYTDSAYIFMPLSAALLTGGLIWVAYLPMLNELNSENQLIWRIIYILAFSFDIYLYLKDYFHNNMFVYDKGDQRQIRDQILTKWGYYITLPMISSLIISMLIILWDKMNA